MIQLIIMKGQEQGLCIWEEISSSRLCYAKAKFCTDGEWDFEHQLVSGFIQKYVQCL